MRRQFQVMVDGCRSASDALLPPCGKCGAMRKAMFRIGRSDMPKFELWRCPNCFQPTDDHVAAIVKEMLPKD